MSATVADGMPRGVAGRSQTVDVYSGSKAISSGGFRLTYGKDSTIITSCIPAVATQLTADVISSSFTSANGLLNVTVEEGDPPYDGSRRFVVYFNEPDVGVGTLGLAEAGGDECKWLECSDGENGECVESGIVINREASVSVQEGVIEASDCLL